jgi:hypothetical protein
MSAHRCRSPQTPSRRGAARVIAAQGFWAVLQLVAEAAVGPQTGAARQWPFKPLQHLGS